MSTLVRCFAAAVAIAAALQAGSLRLAAQPTIAPESLSNRRLGQLNDASAAGWNPAMLGVRPAEFDFLAGGSYDRDLALSQTLYALFAKFGPVAIGSTGPLGDSAGVFAARQYHAGLGVPVLDEGVWAGLGVRWTDGRGFTSSAEYIVSGLYRPRPDLLGGLTVGNLTANNGAGVW